MSNNTTKQLLGQVGDFIGFTFDSIHSSELNLVRVSNGSRYESNLLPSFQDATVQAEGKDGMYYFGSTYKERLIKISTAFDSITEANYRKIIETFSDKKLHKLIFDESPYKCYYVKLKQSPSMKQLCFNEDPYETNPEKRRIYKGEMDLEFVCFTPYAFARVQHIDEAINSDDFVITYKEGNFQSYFHNHILVGINSDGMQTPDYEVGGFYKLFGDSVFLDNSYNYEEWLPASRLENTPKNASQESQETSEQEKFVSHWFDERTKMESNEKSLIRVYNPGDIEADIKLIYTPKNGSKIFPETDIILYRLNQNYEGGYLEETKRLGIKKFNFSKTPSKKEIESIFIDSKTHLISGLCQGEKTGDVFNKYHVVGDFFEIPKSKYEDGYVIEIIGGDPKDWRVEYTYYYV